MFQNGLPPLKVVFIIIFFSQLSYLLILYYYAKTVWGGVCLTQASLGGEFIKK